MPSVPPATDSRTLSVRSWRAIRARPAPRACRTANSFWRLVERARIETGDVGAGNHEDQAHRDHDEIEHGSNLAAFAVQRLSRGKQPDHGSIGFGECRFRSMQDFRAEECCGLGLGLRNRDARLEPACDQHPPSAGIGKPVVGIPPLAPHALRERKRHEEVLMFAGGQAVEAWAGDSDDGRINIVQAHDAPNSGRVGAKGSLPVAIVQNDRRRCGRRIIGRP